MTQETMMTDQPTTITEAPASTEAGQVAPEAQAPAAQPAQEQQQQQGEGQQTEAKAEEQVPEQYADFAFEEGKALDTELADDIKATAKELGLTQSQAQKLADLALKRTESAQSKQAEMLAQARDEWAGQAKADKEFGGDAIEANLATARKGPGESRQGVWRRCDRGEPRHGSQGARHLRHARTESAAQRVRPGESPGSDPVFLQIGQGNQ